MCIGRRLSRGLSVRAELRRTAENSCGAALFHMKCMKFIFLGLQIMSRLDCWGLDVFKVSDLSQERPLTVTTYTIFQVNCIDLCIAGKYLSSFLAVKRSFQVLSNTSSNPAELSNHLGKPLSEECTLSQQSSCC